MHDGNNSHEVTDIVFQSEKAGTTTTLQKLERFYETYSCVWVRKRGEDGPCKKQGHCEGRFFQLLETCRNPGSQMMTARPTRLSS